MPPFPTRECARTAPWVTQQSLWSGHPGREETLEPFPLSLCHSSPDGSVLYLQDNYLQPTGSPSQLYLPRIELAGLQGEASGKLLCSGWWHKGVFSISGGAPTATALLSLAEQCKPSPLPWVCTYSYSHGRKLTCAAKMLPAS